MFSILDLIVAAGGGAFAAAIGAQTSFTFTGFAYLFGMAGLLAAPNSEALGGFIDYVAFGPVFGPHIAWAGGAAATAYAGKMGYIEHGRLVAQPLTLNRPDIFLVGAVFGMGGYATNIGLAQIPGFGEGLGWTDTVALTVVLSHVVARVLFGVKTRSIFGPYPYGPLGTGEGSHWVEHQERWSMTTIHGFFSGLIFAAGAVWVIQNFGADSVIGGKIFLIGWAISALTLLYLSTGVPTPVTHHMTIIGALAAAKFLIVFSLSPLAAVLIGAVFGAIAGLVGEALARLMNNNGDTHIDPPALAIFPMTTVIFAICAMA